MTVKKAVTGISVAPEELTIYMEDTTVHQLTSTAITPEGDVDRNVTWSSSDWGIATIDSSGVITVLRPGTVTLTGTTEDGGYSSSCKLTVKKHVTSVDIPTFIIY